LSDPIPPPAGTLSTPSTLDQPAAEETKPPIPNDDPPTPAVMFKKRRGAPSGATRNVNLSKKY
jgi:hypothetical protein